MKTLFFCLTFLLLTVEVHSQGQPFAVAPIDTDPGYDVNDPDHYLVYNPSVQRGKLLLWIGGSYSNPNLYFRICRFAGDLGFHVISLSYPNGVPVATLGNDPDSTVFERFREEIAFGTPVSNAVSVDTLNSLYTRTINLLKYLDANQPSENWGQFLTGPDSIDWPKVLVGGHSQGAGHAPYLAKTFPTERCLMFSGPNDYSTVYNRGAPWLTWPTATSPAAYFAYLHLRDDVVDFYKQYADLGRLGLSDSTFVDTSIPPYQNAQFLYTNQASPPLVGFHSTPTSQSFINDQVWEYMLVSTILTSVEKPGKHDFVLYPNPVEEQLRVEGIGIGDEVRIWNAMGQLMYSGKESLAPMMIEVGAWKAGVYFLEIEGIVERFMVR